MNKEDVIKQLFFEDLTQEDIDYLKKIVSNFKSKFTTYAHGNEPFFNESYFRTAYLLDKPINKT
jgi:hypothetical protein